MNTCDSNRRPQFQMTRLQHSKSLKQSPMNVVMLVVQQLNRTRLTKLNSRSCHNHAKLPTTTGSYHRREQPSHTTFFRGHQQLTLCNQPLYCIIFNTSQQPGTADTCVHSKLTSNVLKLRLHFFSVIIVHYYTR